MSSPHRSHSQELRITPEEQGDVSTQPATHRFRLFRYTCKGLEQGEFMYAGVWDTLERPLNNGTLPPGEVCFTASNLSLNSIQEEVKSYCQSLGRVEIADWASRGS